MVPTTIAMIAKAAISVGTNKKVWLAVASIVIGLCMPFIVIIVGILSMASTEVEHNRSAVRLAFDGGNIPDNMPSDYRKYIEQMQENFAQIDSIMDEIDAIAEGEVQDRYLVKSVFYSLYFGTDYADFKKADYMEFVECFVKYEERIRKIANVDGGQREERYRSSVAITDKSEILENLEKEYGMVITDEQQFNAQNVWYLARYNITAP